MAGQCRYSLVVSIRAPEVDVDLYTEVANQMLIPVHADHRFQSMPITLGVSE